MRSLFLFLTGFFLLGIFSLKAQELSVDQLKAGLKNAANDTARIWYLACLAESASDDEWPAFNAQAKDMATRKLKNLEAGKPEYELYMRYLGNALNNEGYLSAQNGKTMEALQSYSQSLAAREAIHDRQGIANSFNNIGSVYETLGDIPRALDFYYRGLKIREELGIKESIAVSLNNIGLLYADQGDPDKALEYYLRSLKLQQEIGDKEHEATSLNNIGGLYNEKGDNAKALEYYNQSIRIREEIKDMKGIGYSLMNMGLIYVSDGDPLVISSKEESLKAGKVKAMQNFERAVQIAEQTGDRAGVVAANSNIGYLYLEQKDYDKAIAYGEKSLAMAEAIPYPNYIRHASLNLYKSMKALGRMKEALAYYEKYIATRDTMRNQTNRKVMLRSQLKYEFEKKAAADSVKVAEEKKVTDARLNAEQTQRYALYGGISLVALFALFMVNRFRIISRQKRLIELKEKETQFQKNLIEEKQREIIESIHYARRIQNSLLPREKTINRTLKRLDGEL